MAAVTILPGSARFRLGREDFGKLVFSFVLSAGAALLMAVVETAKLIDWSSAVWGPYIFAMGPFVLNIARKFLQDARPPWQKAQDTREKSLGFRLGNKG